MKPDYRRVLNQVQRVLEESNVIGPPVDPLEIAGAYGVRVEERDFDDFSSEVAGFFDFEERTIYVNDLDPYNRKTFTIAHELGHYFLHQHHFEQNPGEYSVLLRRPIGAATEDPKEKEANAFAANLLVPRKFLDRYYRHANIDELARLFMVSKDVIRNRLKFEYKITSQ